MVRFVARNRAWQKLDFERWSRRIRVAAATGTIFYRPAFLRTARKSQLLSSSCARAEL